MGIGTKAAAERYGYGPRCSGGMTASEKQIEDGEIHRHGNHDAGREQQLQARTGPIVDSHNLAIHGKTRVHSIEAMNAGPLL
jgi:hypothetical protein